MSSRRPNPQKNQQCETCPANNRNVLKVIWKRRTMLMCPACRKVANAISKVERDITAERTAEEVQLKGL